MSYDIYIGESTNPRFPQDFNMNLDQSTALAAVIKGVIGMPEESFLQIEIVRRDNDE